MKRMLALAALSLLGALMLAPAAWAQGQEEVTVRMEDNFFAPANITVEPGTTVTWVQSGNNPHTTTSNDGLWDSGVIPGGSGRSFSFTFEEPGTFDYVCTIHAAQGMVGAVTVTGGTATASPTATPLPGTGGPPASLLSTLGATLALAVFGIIALALVRRRVS